MTHANDLIHPGYTDPVFKHLMSFDDIRNTFLSVVLKKEILDSQIADPALSPFDENHQARTLVEEINKNENLQALKELSQTLSNESKSILQKTLECLPLIQEIFPDKQRLTTLDLVCRTKDRLINVEIQYISQPFWDLRMLVHGGGLVYKQIRKGFNWNHISNEGFCLDKHGKIQPAARETIVIGLMVNPPIHRPDSVIQGLPWYSVNPWKEEEIIRIFCLYKEDQPEVQMPGLVFHQYNLSALYKGLTEDNPGENSRLLRWLNLFARSSAKRLSELKYLQQEEPIL